MTAQNDSIRLYADTFRLQDQKTTVDIDGLLLDMVAEQSVQIHANDTVDTLTLAELMTLDSIQREVAEIDSLRLVNTSLAMQRIEKMPAIVIEKSWVKDAEEDRNDVLRAIRDMKTPWRKEATLMVQVTQNYVTPNWYQGGSSSFAGLLIAKGQIGYYTERFTWENTGEWRAGASTVSADSLHKVNTTDDLLRLYSKANLRIAPKIFTSVSAEIPIIGPSAVRSADLQIELDGTQIRTFLALPIQCRVRSRFQTRGESQYIRFAAVVQSYPYNGYRTRQRYRLWLGNRAADPT